VNRIALVTSLQEIGRLVEECLEAIGDKPAAKDKIASTISPRRSGPGAGTSHTLDFSSPVRFFMKKHATGMNGQQKFTLVIAYLAKGKTNAEVKLAEVRSTWSSMKGILGKFNTGYATWAKDAGWVDSTKPRVYVLMSGWKGIVHRNA
jgi:hypothetical protein